MKIYELKNNINKEIEIEGFIENIRVLQYVIFIVLRDASGKVQITIEREGNDELVKKVESLMSESTLIVNGVCKENEHVKLNGYEVIPSNIVITSECREELPFNYKNLQAVNLDTRLDNRFIDLRNENNALIFKVQSELVKSLREYLYNEDFTEIHTPKLIGAASESGSEVFEVKYFDTKAYLAQSPQFYKQMAMAAGMNRIFEIAPCFRAEKSNTSRHTTEFTSFDVEMSYIKSYENVMDLQQNMLTYGLKNLKEKYGDAIKEKFGVEINVPTKPFPRVKLSDLLDALVKEYGYVMTEEDKYDLNAEAERLSYKYAMDKYNSEFIFVVGYPANKRAFYHMRDKNGVLLGYDLIWKGTEITSGAQREHRYDVIKKQAEEKGLGKDVEFYLNFFKYGCPPHGGFGMGLDRLTMLLLNIPTIKESMFLFRGPTRLNP